MDGVLIGGLQPNEVLIGHLTTEKKSLSGNLSTTKGEIVGRLQPDEILIGYLTTEKESLSGSLSAIIVGEEAIDPYTGEYTVTPKAYESNVLHTNGLKMLGDVVVLKVPYYETSNVSDGYTVYIAEE